MQQRNGPLYPSLSRFTATCLPLIIFIVLHSSCITPTSTNASRIYSAHVGDSFELYIDLPPGYSGGKEYSIVFYMDANLKMGQEVRRQIRLEENREKLSKVIFVGVGHIGNYRTLRRRDFIPPVLKDGQIQTPQDKDYGHADKFYQFLTKELIPHINDSLPNNGGYSLAGHSFSGLFAFYAMMQEQPVFRNYIAMSPSLWVNDHNIFEYQKRSQIKQQATLYHSCGTAEWANRVLSSSRKMKGVLETENKTQLKYIYYEHQGENHNGTVAPSLRYVFSKMHLY